MDEIMLDAPGIAKALLTDKKVMEFSGNISVEYFMDSWDAIYLEQTSGYKICLNSRLDEACNNNGGRVSMCYWITKDPKTADELIGLQMLAADGFLDNSFEKEEWAYSEYTQGTDYNTNLKIGGHSLMEELRVKTGYYLYMMVEWSN